jgi:hypothetical protein
VIAMGASLRRNAPLAGVILLVTVSAAAQSRPDLSGVWSPYRPPRGASAPPPPTPLLLKPGYKEKYDARRAKEREAAARGEQLAARGLCEPYGMPGMMQVAVYPMEVIQTPRQITIIAEAFSEVRRIYLDKPQLPLEDIDPGYYGRSVGRWEGDALVVDTIGIKDSINGYQGMPHSAQMRITERIRRPAKDLLEDLITIDDPVTLEKPVSYTLSYKLMPDYEMVEFVCENNREFVDENGVVRMKLHDK